MTDVLAPPQTPSVRQAPAPAEVVEHVAGLGVPILALTFLAHATGGRLQPQLVIVTGAAVLACAVLRVWRLPVGWWAGAGAVAAAGLAVALLHTPPAHDPLAHFYRFTAADGYVLAAALVVNTRSYALTTRRRRAVLLTIAAAGALQFAWAFTPWWGGGHPAAQMVGTFYWHNQYAAFLLAPAVVGFAVAIEGRRPWRFLGWVGAVLGTAGIFYSTSRATLAVLIGCLAMVAGYALWRAPARRVAAVRIVGLVLAAGLVVLAMSSPPLVASGHNPFDGEQRRTAGQSLSQNGNYRVDFWREAVVVAAHHPIAGAGYGELARATHGHVPAGYPTSPLAHESLLQAFADGGLLLGIPVLAGVVGLLVLTLRRSGALLRRRPDSEVSIVEVAAVVALGGLLAHALVDFDWSYPALFAMGAIIAAIAASRPSDDAAEPGTRGDGVAMASNAARQSLLQRDDVACAVPTLQLDAIATRKADRLTPSDDNTD